MSALNTFQTTQQPKTSQSDPKQAKTAKSEPKRAQERP